MESEGRIYCFSEVPDRKQMTLQVWQPTKTNAFRFRGLSVLLGGPQSATMPEHAHSEAQVTVHFYPAPRNRSHDVEMDASLYAPEQPHLGGWRKGCRVVVFHLSPGLLIEAADELVVSEAFKIRPFSGRRERLFEEMARLMLHEVVRPDRMSHFYAESIGHVVAGHILRSHCDTRPRLKTQNALTAGELLAVRRFLDEQIETRFGVVDLARVVGLGPQRFAAKLRAATGLSPWRYVQAYRITHAQRMLRNRSIPIVEISGLLGFASQSHFTNTFRNRVGVTPNAYRNMSY